MSDTLSMIAETRFFLEKMRETDTQPTEYQHYLNAFIKSARNITWILRHEFSEIPGWKQWYDSVVPSLEESKILEIQHSLNRLLKRKFGCITHTGLHPMYIFIFTG